MNIDAGTANEATNRKTKESDLSSGIQIFGPANLMKSFQGSVRTKSQFQIDGTPNSVKNHYVSWNTRRRNIIEMKERDYKQDEHKLRFMRQRKVLMQLLKQGEKNPKSRQTQIPFEKQRFLVVHFMTTDLGWS